MGRGLAGVPQRCFESLAAPVSFIFELLFEFAGQILLELIVEVLFGVGDAATGGRMKRVLLFGAAGAVAGTTSFLIRPARMIAESAIRYGAIVGLTLAGGLALALIESRVRRGGPGSATAGFLCGVAFGLTYVGMRRLLLP